MPSATEPPEDIVDRIRAICMPLPDTVEHDAWKGISWRVAGTTFAHVLQIADGKPPAYVRAFGTTGPATVVTFQAHPEERIALGQHGPPFHLPPWRPGIVGAVITAETDWTELSELLTDSHRLCRATRR